MCSSDLLGGKEMEERNITWRRYSVKEQTTVSLDAALGALEVMRKERLMDNFEDVGLPLA